MKMMMKRSAIAGAVLCAFACGVALAQERGPRGPRPGDGPGGPPPMDRMLDRLGLTDDQKAAVQAVHEKNQDTLRPLGEAARHAHEAFQKALDTEADAGKVGQLALAMNAAQKKFDAARKAEMDEIKAILTPEQREKFEQAMQRGPGRPPGGPGAPGGPGGPGGPRPDGPPDRD